MCRLSRQSALQADSSGKLSCVLKSSFKPCQNTFKYCSWFCHSVHLSVRMCRSVRLSVCLCLSLPLYEIDI